MSIDSFRLPRTLVLCFDGTSNQYNGSNTNIVKFYALLKKDSTEQQLCYYQPGIGTYIQTGVVSPLVEWGAKILDQAVAWYLNAHVQGGYQFLMQNYNPGDKICIFGFSRGAYTARALAGMLHKIGLLPRDNSEQLPLAYRLYKRTDLESIQLAAGFKKTFCRDVLIEFVGVWDTVASVGLLKSRTLPFTTTNTTIKTFRHALALDERRAKFRPNLYHRVSPNPQDAVKDPEHGSFSIHRASTASTTASISSEILKKLSPKKHAFSVRSAMAWVPFSGKTKKELDPMEDPSGHDTSETDVLEVWFAGCHGDVGGGSVPNEIPHSLSDVSLRWMVNQISRSQCGITFDKAAIARADITPDLPFFLGHIPSGSSFHQRQSIEKKSIALNTPVDNDRRGMSEATLTVGQHSEISHDDHYQRPRDDRDSDALAPESDQLRKAPIWWLLEIMPTSYAWQDAQGRWHRDIGFHMGKGRRIPDDHPNFHESVRARINDGSLKYKPRAVWKEGTENYVF